MCWVSSIYLPKKALVKDQKSSWDLEVQDWPRLTLSPQTIIPWRWGRRRYIHFLKEINQYGEPFHVRLKPERSLAWKKLSIGAWNKHLVTSPSVKILFKTFSIMLVPFDTQGLSLKAAFFDSKRGKRIKILKLQHYLLEHVWFGHLCCLYLLIFAIFLQAAGTLEKMNTCWMFFCSFA